MNSTQDRLAEAVQALANVCDGARSEDGAGYNGVDSPFMKSLAMRDPQWWSHSQRAVAYRILKKYSKQLRGYGIDFSLIPVPPPKPPEKNRTTPQIDTADGRFIITFDYDAATVARLKQTLVNAQFRKTPTPHWWLDVSLIGCERIMTMVSDSKFEMTAAAEALVWNTLNAAPDRLAASHAKDTPLGFTLPDSFGSPSGRRPRSFQYAGIKYGIDVQNPLIGDDMGLGKTVQALGWAVVQNLFPLFVVCTASTKANWAIEAKAWIPGVRVQVVETAKDAIVDADIYVVTYQMVSAGWVDGKKKAVYFKQPIIDISKRGIKGIICDESHRIKDPKTQQSCGLMQLRELTRHRACLSGSPSPNGRPVELIPQLDFLDKLQELGGAWHFKKHFCDGKQKHLPGKGLVWDFSGASNQDEMNRLLRSAVMIRRMKEDVATELPPKTKIVIPVQITNRPEYRKWEREAAKLLAEIKIASPEFQAELEGLEASEALLLTLKKKEDTMRKAKMMEALIKYGKLRALSGAGKLAGVDDWLEDYKQTGKKLLIWGFYKETQQELLKLAIKHYGAHAVVHLFSADSSAERQEAIRRFNEDPTCLAMVISIGAGKEGVNLQAADTAIFPETCLVPGEQEQAEDRIHRMGQKNPVTIYKFVGVNTIDEDVEMLLEGKEAIISQGLDGDAATQLRGQAALLERLKQRMQ